MEGVESKQKDMETGERIYLPEINKLTPEERRHVNRYYFALNYISPKNIVLDAACGSGYGTKLLAAKAKKVFGLDNNSHALEYAKDRNISPNIEYVKTDLNEPLRFFNDGVIDVIISYETLEHIKNPALMVREFYRLLKPGGYLIISTPNKDVSRLMHTKNEFHLREFTKKEFLMLIGNSFKVDKILGQTKYKKIPNWRKKIKNLLKLFIRPIKARPVIVSNYFSNLSGENLEEIIDTDLFFNLIGVFRKMDN